MQYFQNSYITFNPMQYIKLKNQAEEVDLFSDDDIEEGVQPILTRGLSEVNKIP